MLAEALQLSEFIHQEKSTLHALTTATLEVEVT
jgi:hypothetical protein